jgi:hypothetical protein
MIQSTDLMDSVGLLSFAMACTTNPRCPSPTSHFWNIIHFLSSVPSRFDSLPHPPGFARRCGTRRTADEESSGLWRNRATAVSSDRLPWVREMALVISHDISHIEYKLPTGRLWQPRSWPDHLFWQNTPLYNQMSMDGSFGTGNHGISSARRCFSIDIDHREPISERSLSRGRFASPG